MARFQSTGSDTRTKTSGLHASDAERHWTIATTSSVTAANGFLGKSNMKTAIALLLAALLWSSARADDTSAYKKVVVLWYDAFTNHDPAPLDRILGETWVDIPSAPGLPPGPQAAKDTLALLTTTFPDLKVTIDDIIQDGNKVVVRSHITGTQKASFLDFPAKNRTLNIQAVDIHEFKDGKIARTWHTEDWMTGLRQLGVFDK